MYCTPWYNAFDMPHRITKTTCLLNDLESSQFQVKISYYSDHFIDHLNRIQRAIRGSISNCTCSCLKPQKKMNVKKARTILILIISSAKFLFTGSEDPYLFRQKNGRNNGKWAVGKTAASNITVHECKLQRQHTCKTTNFAYGCHAHAKLFRHWGRSKINPHYLSPPKISWREN